MTEWESSKKKGLLDAARRLFWKYGYKRVTVEEVCEEAAVSKMTFYKMFSNKLELARAVFDKEVARAQNDFRSIMESELTPAEKFNKIFKLKHEGTNDISSEFLNDFYKNPELGLKEHIEKTSLNVWQEIINDLKKAQDQGVIRKEFRPELIWYLSQKMMEMMNDENLRKMYNTPQEMIMDLTGFFLYGMLPSGNEK